MFESVDLGSRTLESYRGVAPDHLLEDLVREAEILSGARVLHLCQRRSQRSQLWRLKMSHPAGGDEPQIVAASRRLRVRLG